ncbi:MAG: hypothetical protein E7647_02810 [Ruminococcaceae bacterium]|nr:hypothetical protein [Oscillospiraceae bacterium]
MSKIKKTVLTFETLPKGLGITKSIIFGIIDISGIQKYIFGSMSTLSSAEDIRRRSAYVESLSHKICEMLRERFNRAYLFGTVSSGKVQCAFSPGASMNKLTDFCKKLQRAVFASTEGGLTFYYSFCRARCIQASDYDPKTMVTAPAVASGELEKQKFNCKNLLLTDMENDFCRDLCPPAAASDENAHREEPSRAMAAVKLDLDNLGLFFRNVGEFDKRHRISTALNDTISECIRSDGRITPIFAGGDDIFFLCRARDCLSVTVDFYKRLKNAVLENSELSDYGKDGVFGISAGAVRILSEHGRVPILIFGEKAEKKLHLAKTRGGKNCVCIGDSIIGWQELMLLWSNYSRIFDTEGDIALLFDLQLMKERILKYAGYNKNSPAREEADAIESIRILLL